MRHTQNMQRVATFADAIRHMGNIVNTYKGGPLQRFNDPTDYLMAGYEKRKAERTKRDALAADQAYKNANLSLKERAAEAKNAYDQLILGYKDAADKRAAQAYADNKKYKDDYFTWQKGEAKQKQDNWQKQFDENVRHHKALEGISASKGNGRSSRSSSGSGYKYWFDDKNGKRRYQTNKTMWEQEYYREYGRLPQGESSTSVTTKTTNYRTGAEVTTTTRRKGASVTSQAAASQNAAKRARNKPKSAQKHNALNNWFKKNYK